MNISQRGAGNTNILKQIQEASKQISQQTGLDKAMQLFPEQPKVDESKLGAAASMGFNRVGIPDNTQQMLQEMIDSGASYKATQGRQNERPVSVNPVQSTGNIKFDFTRSYVDRLVDNIELLGSTKEYFNALQSLLSLYALGYLDDNVLDKLSREDIKEIKGIVREFKSILDEY